MSEPISSTPHLSNLRSNRESRSERGHGYFHRIFKFGKKKDKLSDNELIAEDPQQDNRQDASQHHHPEDRKRVKSLNKSRSRMATSTAPRSGKLFALAGRTHRRLLKRGNVNDKESKDVDADRGNKPDRPELFTDSLPSPSSILAEEEADALEKIRRKRVSLRAIRHTVGNSTMMFAKDGMPSSPELLPVSKKTKSENQEDLRVNSSNDEKQAFAGLRTRSLLDISSWPSVKAQRVPSAIHSVSCNTSVQPERLDCRNNGVEVISVHSEGGSSESLDITTSGGSRIYSFRCLFHEQESQDLKDTTRVISLGSSNERHRQKPQNEESNRLLVRRSSSLPQNLRTSALNLKGVSNSKNKRLASSDDGLQSPWGVKPARDASEEVILKHNAPLTFRVPDLSSALNFTGKKGKSRSSVSIDLSDDDHERSESDGSEEKVEMQRDDFIEYTVKVAKKLRK